MRHDRIFAALAPLALALTITPTALALDKFGCGTYLVTGTWRTEKGRVELLIHARSTSEERVALLNAPAADMITRNGTPVQVRARVDQPFEGSGGRLVLL